MSTDVPHANDVSGKSGAISCNDPPYCEPCAITRSNPASAYSRIATAASSTMKVPSVTSTSNSRISPNAATPSTMLCVNARSFDADGATIATRNGPDGSAGGGGGGASSVAGASSAAGASVSAAGAGAGGGASLTPSSSSPAQAAASSTIASSAASTPKELARLIDILDILIIDPFVIRCGPGKQQPDYQRLRQNSLALLQIVCSWESGRIRTPATTRPASARRRAGTDG